MSNIRDDAGKTPAPKTTESYQKSTGRNAHPDQIALVAATKIEQLVLGTASSGQRLAKIQVIVREALDEARVKTLAGIAPKVMAEHDFDTTITDKPLGPPTVLFPAKENPSDLGLVSEVELAAALKVTTQALAVWRASDEGPVYARLGRSIYYKRTDIDDWINGNRSA